MNGRLRSRLQVGDTFLMDVGPAHVNSIAVDGCHVTDARGEDLFVQWIDLRGSKHAGDSEGQHHRMLSPWWEMLDAETQREALFRLAVVLEVLTGFQAGHAELAREGEPFHPFGPTSGISVSERCRHMAEQLTRQRQSDRNLVRRVEAGELKDLEVSVSTVKLWVRRYQQLGLLGIVDGRKMRASGGFEVLDPEFRQTLLQIVETFDGDPSSVSHKEVIRRARVAMKQSGRLAYAQPARATGEYVSWLFKERGHSTRAQRSNAIRGTSAKAHFPAIRIGQVIAIDATRADVLVWDPLHERPISVEILTAIDVASRCVLACRVVPKSADAVDGSLLLYDVMRPFHMVVAGTDISQWRWAGLPGALDLQDNGAVFERAPLAPSATLQGVHTIPGLLPEAIRSDRGSIFVSTRFQEVCSDFGIDFLPSRGRRPSDNAHGERIHLTYDGFYQQLSGYKGNNVAARGRAAEREPVYTAAELEELLRRWIALDYHQSWHQGIVLPDAPTARMTPIEAYDAILSATGRVDLGMGPSALYQFLPIRWGTVRHDGVEFNNMVYDSTRLDAFRNVRPGQFRDRDRAMPFFYDPHDVSRVWWTDPDTEVVHEIPWRGQHQFEAPMTDAILDHALKRIRGRGGNLALNRESTQQLILREATQLYEAPPTRETRALLSAAARRVETSQRDHEEAHAAQASAEARRFPDAPRLDASPPRPSTLTFLDDEWPDLEQEAT